MANAISKKRTDASRRAYRTRARIHGTAKSPRLCVSRSLRHISAQLIDDDAGKTMVSVSDHHVEKKGKPSEIAKSVGVLLAEKAKKASIESVIFDRGVYRFHGRVAMVAEGAREGGLKF